MGVVCTLIAITLITVGLVTISSFLRSDGQNAHSVARPVTQVLTN